MNTYNSATRVNVYDGETMEQTGSNVLLIDCFPDDLDEQAAAMAVLKRDGRYWAGGGAAPLVLLTKISP